MKSFRTSLEEICKDILFFLAGEIKMALPWTEKLETRRRVVQKKYVNSPSFEAGEFDQELCAPVSKITIVPVMFFLSVEIRNKIVNIEVDKDLFCRKEIGDFISVLYVKVFGGIYPRIKEGI